MHLKKCLIYDDSNKCLMKQKRTLRTFGTSKEILKSRANRFYVRTNNKAAEAVTGDGERGKDGVVSGAECLWLWLWDMGTGIEKKSRM